MHVIERVLVEVVSPVFAGASESDLGLTPDGSASERPSYGTCAGCVSHAEYLALTSCVTWGPGGVATPWVRILVSAPCTRVRGLLCARVWVGTSLLRIVVRERCTSPAESAPKANTVYHEGGTGNASGKG